MASKKQRLKYDTDESHRQKHRWDRPDAALILDEDDKLIGKCSSRIDTKLAERLLNNAIPWSPRSWRKLRPKELYTVFAGVPYRAHSMGPNAYHGFPDAPRRIPPEVVEELRARAKAEGFLDRFEDWMQGDTGAPGPDEIQA